MSKARVLAERQIVGEIALELVAEHLLLARELVDAGIASEKAGRDLAERGVGHRALIGQEVDAAGVLLGGRGQHRERGVGVRLPGHGRRDEVVVVGREVDLRGAFWTWPTTR